MKTIKFKDNFGEYQNGTPYILAENEPLTLTFDFSENTQKPKRLKVVFCVGKKKSRILDISDLFLEIPYEFIAEAVPEDSAAELCFELHEFTETGFEINKGHYKVEPLLVVRVSEKIEAYPIIQKLKTELQTLTNTMTEDKKQSRLNKLATLRYLYRHYTKDLTDSDQDLTVAGFALAIGFDVSDLSEEELNEITEFATKEGVL